MSVVSVSLPTDGTTADAADYNTPITTIVNEFNGNIDNANVKSGAAIDGAKLAAGTVSFTQVATGAVVQVVMTTFSAFATGTTLIPIDDTIPQITEGNQFMTQAITPKSSTNLLIIDVIPYVTNSVSGRMVHALFQDSTANALAAFETSTATATYSVPGVISYSMTAGTTSATTFKYRAGAESAGTLTFNGISGARFYGAIPKSMMRITEVKV